MYLDQDEKLNFLSATLGSHMVLQRAPQQAMVWGHTAPGAKVTTSMASGSGATAVMATLAGADGTWRQKLPATQASKVACWVGKNTGGNSKNKTVYLDLRFLFC